MRKGFTPLFKLNEKKKVARTNEKDGVTVVSNPVDSKFVFGPEKSFSRLDYYIRNLDHSAKLSQDTFSFSFNSPGGSEGRHEISIGEMEEVLTLLESFVVSGKITPEKDTAVNCIKKTIQSDGQRVRFKTSNMPDAEETVILQQDMSECVRALREVLDTHIALLRNRY